jgi:hypothetical protein
VPWWLAGKERQIDLARAALLVAREEYSTLDVQGYRNQLHQCGRVLRTRVSGEPTPER